MRVAKHVMQEIRQGSTSVRNIGWGLAKRLYSTEELLQCYCRGVGKLALSPRRKRFIEEAIRDNYDNSQEILRGVRKSIDAGIGDKKKRVPAPSTTSHPPFILPQRFDYNIFLKNLQAATSHDSLHRSNMF